MSDYDERIHRPKTNRPFGTAHDSISVEQYLGTQSCVGANEARPKREIEGTREDHAARVESEQKEIEDMFDALVDSPRPWADVVDKTGGEAAAKSPLTLPIDSQERKNYPLYSGCLKYFPAALAGVARTSKLGNDKHNPGQEMHHARGKSADHGDCILRHLVDVTDLLTHYKYEGGAVSKEQILTEVNQMVWRALAFSQELHEKLGSPLAPGAVCK